MTKREKAEKLLKQKQEEVAEAMIAVSDIRLWDAIRDMDASVLNILIGKFPEVGRWLSTMSRTIGG